MTPPVVGVAMISMHADPTAELGDDRAGGQNVYLREMALALERRGVAVDVLTRRDRRGLPEVEPFGTACRVIRIQAGPDRHLDRARLGRYMATFSDAAASLVASGQRPYQVVHTHYWHSGWVGMRVCSRLGLPQYHTSHSLGVLRYGSTGVLEPSARLRIATEREVIRGCQRVVATCPQEEWVIRQHYAPDARVDVVPCGVNLAYFRPRSRVEARQALGLPGEQPTIVFVGRFDRRKGLDTLLGALTLLRAEAVPERPPPRLLVVGGATGDGDDRRELDATMARILRLDLRDAVRMVGRVPHERLGLYYAAADVVVVPSWYEPFGLVVLEAMACARPVVACAVGGLQHTVADGVTGMLVPPRDAEALARATRRLLGDHQLREAMGRAGAARVRERFTWPLAADQLLSIYQLPRQPVA
jgi:glycosyltransferase involved in cell wall biosynthesis